MQVVDVKGPTVLQMIKHMRSAENQAEFSHNSDYVPESLGKVRCQREILMFQNMGSEMCHIPLDSKHAVIVIEH